jgi:hypothetical protein
VIAERAVCIGTSCSIGRTRRAVADKHFSERGEFVALCNGVQWVDAEPVRDVPPGIRVPAPQFWSHYQTVRREVRRALADKLASLMMLENDVLLEPNIAPAVVELLAAIERARVQAPLVIMLGGKNKVRPLRHVGFVRCLDTTTSHAVLFTRAGLELVDEILGDAKYLERMAPRLNVLDQVLGSRMASDLITYGPEIKWLAHQRIGRSSMTGHDYQPGLFPGVITKPDVWNWSLDKIGCQP